MASLTYLADACALIFWHGRGGESMSRSGRKVMAEGDVFVSPMTVWEITREVVLGKLARPVPVGYSGGFARWLTETGYRILPLSWDDCERANGLPEIHKDPMDRILIASALGNEMTIITNDKTIVRYGVRTIW